MASQITDNSQYVQTVVRADSWEWKNAQPKKTPTDYPEVGM